MEFRFVGGPAIPEPQIAELGKFEKEIYVPAFPDEGEREPFANILERIQSGTEAYPQTFAVLAENDGLLAGGMIFDWYPDCTDAELIYIAIRPESRRSGLGNALLREGTELFCRTMRAEGRTVRRIYFETENPFLSSSDDGMDKISRIHFFARNAACRVPVNYYQPPLSPESPWADNLYLCILPDFSQGGASIPARELKDFLSGFYRGLGAPETHRKFQEMLQSIDYASDNEGNVNCHSFAEEPQFRITRFSMVHHFLLEGNSVKAEDEDPIFNSYECDLMNYSLQDISRRPVRTVHVRQHKHLVLKVPRFYRYTSEGQDFYKLSGHTELHVSVSVNCSENMTHNITLAHLVITPHDNPNLHFNELDCIKLITAFGSPQEKYVTLDMPQIRIEDPESGQTWGSAAELVSSDFGGRKCRLLHNGITEIDLAGVQDNTGELLFSSFEPFRASALSEEPEESPWNMAFCGLVLGIFDFRRMNSAEISDTINPIVLKRDSFIVLCRGHLMKIKFGEKAEDKTANILISPYLLIPSATLSINELVLDRNERIISQPLPDKSSYYRRSMILSERIRCVMNSMNTEYLTNIFHYPSEQEIMEEGASQRGLTRRLGQMKYRLEKERMLMEEYKSKSRLGPDYFTNAMLAILALLQVTAPFFDKSLWLVLSLASIAAIGVYSWAQLNRRRKL